MLNQHPYDAFKQKPFPRSRSLIERIMDAAGINRFFLRPGKPPQLRLEENIIVSPVHGTVAEVESLAQSQPIRGKNRFGRSRYYQYEEIVKDTHMKNLFEGGLCINLYLSPLRWHYCLAPDAFQVQSMRYHSHFCWPIVFMKSAEVINERLVLYCQTPQGVSFIFVFVGSFMVSGIECLAKEGSSFERGQLLGGFKLGSTVMLLFPPDTVEPCIEKKSSVLPGEPIARWLK